MADNIADALRLISPVKLWDEVAKEFGLQQRLDQSRAVTDGEGLQGARRAPPYHHAVTQEDVQRVAERVLGNERVVALVGPFEEDALTEMALTTSVASTS